MTDVFELHELAIRSLGVSVFISKEKNRWSQIQRKKKKTFTIFLSWHFFCSSWFQGLRWVPMTVYCKKLTSKYLLVLWGWPDFDWEGKYGFSVPRMRYILQIKFAYYILTKWMNFSIKCNILNNYNFNNFDNICI